MPKVKYQTGQVFNYWTLISYEPEKKQWWAECVCGKRKLVWVSHLSSGKSISCSCIGKHSHGLTDSPEYKSWSGAKYRCTNPENERFSAYGGRGIKMCASWLNSFETFLKDMGKRPEGRSLDRIDNNGDYSPENCRWATPQEQADNKRDTVRVGGVLLKEAADLVGLKPCTLYSRLRRGASEVEALNTPHQKGKPIGDSKCG